MKIGEVAEKAGVSVRALRYYEEQHLLESERSSGGHRQYSDGAVEQVRLIQQLYASGLSSKLVRDILPRCIGEAETLPGFVETLRMERDRMDQQIAAMIGIRDRLDALITAGEAPEHCGEIGTGSVRKSTAVPA